jgi:hypothetical protein
MNHEAASQIRKCRKCSQVKDGSEFRPDKLAKSGKLYARKQCRECENESWRRDWRAGKKARQSAAVLALSAPSAAPAPQLIARDSEGRLEELVQDRMARYQRDALDALYDLAMMPISENSMQNQVKLTAAAKLAGTLLTPDNSGRDHELGKLLVELNESYQANAPRIRAIRERIVTFEQDPSP